MRDGKKSCSLRICLEWVHCGKSTCKQCGGFGRGHGPYYYLYGRRNGRRSRAYLGRKLDWPFTLFDLA